jgi:hypothetical protein
MLAGRVDIGYLLTLHRLQGALALQQRNFREPHDGAKRRAQFVAHVGEELVLGLVGLLGYALRRPSEA